MAFLTMLPPDYLLLVCDFDSHVAYSCLKQPPGGSTPSLVVKSRYSPCLLVDPTRSSFSGWTVGVVARKRTDPALYGSLVTIYLMAAVHRITFNGRITGLVGAGALGEIILAGTPETAVGDSTILFKDDGGRIAGKLGARWRDFADSMWSGDQRMHAS